MATGLVGFGLLLGFSIRASIAPRMDGMPITGGSAGSMPGITTPASGTDTANRLTADLKGAHDDLEAARFLQAVAVYERILRDDPHNMEALIHYGTSLAAVGELTRGLAALDQALAMDPENLHALWSKAQTLFDVKRDYAASIPLWERIASLAPDSADAATARGYVLRAKERLVGGPRSTPGKGSP
jgi:tetratricopeptide (TPR) repeat protein